MHIVAIVFFGAAMGCLSLAIITPIYQVVYWLFSGMWVEVDFYTVEAFSQGIAPHFADYYRSMERPSPMFGVQWSGAFQILMFLRDAYLPVIAIGAAAILGAVAFTAASYAPPLAPLTPPPPKRGAERPQSTLAPHAAASSTEPKAEDPPAAPVPPGGA